MSGELSFYHIVAGNMADRNDLELWWSGSDLVERVASVCNNTIVVVHSVGPVYMPWSDHPNVTAVIYAGAPGEQTGPAIVDVIYGAYNPSGRLPFTIADVRFPTSFVRLSLNSILIRVRTCMEPSSSMKVVDTLK
jgi:beta-glucosidase